MDDQTSPPRPTSIKRRAVLGLKITVSAGLLYVVLSTANTGDVLRVIRDADLLFLLLALLTPFGGYYFTSLRWKGLLAAAGVRIGQWPLFRASMFAIFFNQLMPSTIGGDLARMYEAWRAGAPKAVAVSSLLLDRVIGIFALAVLGFAAIPFVEAEFQQPLVVYGFVTLITVGVAGVMAMVFAPVPAVLRVFRWMYQRLPAPIAKVPRKLDSACEGYRGNLPVFLRAFACSLAIQFNVILMHWLIARSLGIEIGFDQLMFVVPIALIVMLAPISINGIGIREGIFTVLLAAYGVASAEAVALALVSYGLFLVHAVQGGILFASRGIRLKQLQRIGDEPPASAQERVATDAAPNR